MTQEANTNGQEVSRWRVMYVQAFFTENQIILWLYILPATIVFQGRCHGLPLLFQTGRLWGDDPRIIPWDQPETASSTGGHFIEEHNAQGKRKTCGCRLMNTTWHFVVILFQENINTLGHEISKMNRWWKIYRQLLIIFQLIFRSFQADSAPVTKHLWFSDKSYCYVQ